MTSIAELPDEKLENMLRETAVERAPRDLVVRRGTGEASPLSAEQNQLWFHAWIAPEVPLYNEPITIHRRGSFDFEALERSLNEIIRRHEIWRTSFELKDGQPRSVVHPDLKVTLEFDDVSHLRQDQRDQAALKIAYSDACRPFELSRPPLLRARVVRLSEDLHRLYLTLHHIIFDDVSIYRVMVPELTALYQNFAEGLPRTLPEPALQYADYVLWRDRQLAGGPMNGGLAYWRKKLDGDLPTLKMPSDRPAPMQPTYRGSMETFTLSGAMLDRLKAVGAQEGVTLSATLLAAFKTMLHRYSGQDDIIVGGLTDMRRRPELENLMGYFLNGFALRTRPSTNMSFRAYLAEVQATAIEALGASIVPFDRVVREVRAKREGRRHPLFQVTFSIQPPMPRYADGWSLTQMDVEVEAAKFDLSLELQEQTDRILGRFLYGTDLFEAATIRRMIGHYTALLEGVVENPDCTLGRLPLVTPDERHDLLIERNHTACEYPETTLHAWFEAQARRTPDAIAVECEGVRWRYCDLRRHVAVLAARLRQAGVEKETLVGVAMERSPWMVAGLLAILKAGGAYLPLDPDLPRARLALLMGDACPAILLSEPSALRRLPPSNARIVLCEELSGVDTFEPAVEAHVEPHGLAYVLYTSGSTGRPKAVEITHRSLVNQLAAIAREIDFNASDSFLAVATLSFDIAGLELLLPLVTGARTIIATRDDAADPVRLSALITRCHCTTIQGTPATFRGLLETGWQGDKRLKVLCGGEALPTGLASALLQRSGTLWNVYGPTETTIWSLLHKVAPGDDPVPLGRPLSNYRIYVVDEEGVPVPIGVFGELLIAGVGLARGYRNDPALTEQKYVAFASIPGERVYRTGDVGRYRADGNIEFGGRKDNQVKIRGFRVGLEEVESTVAAYPDVEAAAVRALPDRSGELTLAAYVAGAGLDDEAVAGLRRFLRQQLPAYMVPTHYSILPALPKTPNGKVDYKRLPEPQFEGPATQASQPRDDLERTLARIWKDLLALPDVGIHDNFFDLGGHSLLAFMLMAKLKAELVRELPLAALFGAPTIAGLAEQLRRTDETGFSHLVLLRSSGKGRPLYIVHGIFGNVLQFRELARHLHIDRPIYALQARGADPAQQPHATIEEMVDAYLDAIQRVQKTGPFALAGYSFGGLIAFEMARRLREQGQEVDFLGLFETEVDERCLPLADALRYRLTLASRVIEKLAGLPLAVIPRYLKSKIQQISRTALVRAGWRDAPVSLEGVSGALSDRYYDMFQIGARQFRAFRPKPYAGRIDLFVATGPRYGTCDPLPIWRRTGKSVEVCTIAGTHETIMEEPHVRCLAAELTKRLAALELRPANPVEPPKQRLL